MIKIRTECAECPCYLCEFTCNCKQTLAQHTVTRHNTPESLICTYCHRKLRDISSVRRHIKTVHINKKDYMCTYCNKRYKHKFDLEKHFSKKHKARPPESRNFCSECKLLCMDWEELKKHYLDAHGKTIQHIKCPQCYKIFFEVVYLKSHFKKVHNNKTINVVYCQHCGSVFEDDSALLRHMEDKHCNWDGDTSVLCQETSPSEENFEGGETSLETQGEHQKKKKIRIGSSEEIFTCQECGDMFANKTLLVTHLMEMHHWKSVMECQRCFRIFPSTLQIQEHLNSHFLEPDDAPLLPSGKHSILKKRLLKRRSIKDLSVGLQPRFFVGFVKVMSENNVITDLKFQEPILQQEIEVETNTDKTFSDNNTTYPESYSSDKPGDMYTVDQGCHSNSSNNAPFRDSNTHDVQKYEVGEGYQTSYSVREESGSSRDQAGDQFSDTGDVDGGYPPSFVKSKKRKYSMK